LSPVARDALLTVRGVRKRFGGLHALDGVSLDVGNGSITGLIGPNGAGKTTLFEVVSGLLAPDSGTVQIEGRTIAGMDRKARARLIQPVFQDPFSSLNPLSRIRDIVAMPLVAQGGVGRAEIARLVDEMLARVGLSAEMGRRLPAELSGGQRQRVAIARALVLKPRIVVCDEPTSALDVSVQAQILNLLHELRRDLGLTYLFISHNLAVVEHVATEVAVMYLGRIVERAPTDRLFATPEHPYTKALLASVLTPEPGLGVPDVGLGDALPDPANIPSGCRFHPRCPIAEPRCAATMPPFKPRPEGGVECLLA